MEHPLVSIPALMVWTLVLVFFRAYRIWLPFFVIGSVGLATAIIYFGRGTIPLESWLETYAALGVHEVAKLVGVETELVENIPGALLVLVISQEIGWTVLYVNIESSGLPEMSVFVGLIAFYPAWSFRKKLVLLSIGLAATYVANVVRLLVIVAMLHWGGKDTLFMTHTIVARALFMSIVVIVYWYTLTKPTIRTIEDNLRRGRAG